MERLLATIIELLLPLRSLDSAESVRGFLEELGYLLPEGALPSGSPIDFRASLAGGLELAARLQTLDTLDDRIAALEEAQRLVRAVWSSARALHSTVTADLETIPQFLSETGLRDNFLTRLLDYLIVTYLRKTSPRTHSLLEVIGLVSSVSQRENAATFQSECTLHTLHFERIATLIESPRSLANELYRWEANFDSDTFLDRLSQVMASFGLVGNLLPDDIPSADPVPPTGGPRQLFMPLVSGGSWPETFWQLGLRVEAAASSGTQKKGLAIIPYAEGTVAASVSLAESLQLELALGTSLDSGIGLTVRPPASVRVEKNLFTQPAPSTDTQLGLELTYSNPAEDLVLLGSASATRLTARSVRVEAGLDGNDLYLEFGLPDWSLVVDAGEGDSFIADLLGSLPLNVGGDLTLGYALSRGFYIQSAAELCLIVPIHKSLGPFYLAETELRLSLDAEQLALETTLTGNVTLGPFVLTLERVGLRSALEWAAADGVLGDVDVYFAFKPPSGIGLAVNAGPVSGGGFLSIDSEKGEYAGAAQLALLGVGITAIGIVSTQLPDGSEGWAFILSLSMNFPSLQLGFGFTLNGVGGLVAVNRTLDPTVLQEGLKSGSLDALLFPDDPVAQAPALLALLDSAFPIAVGQYTFGPVVEIGWGTPTLMTAQIGVIISVPEPVIVVILGRFSAFLPDPETALVTLQLDVLGVIDFAAGTVSVDAVLRDSGVAGLTLSGAMALRSTFLSEPSFLLSFGGFHPDFQPPDDVPDLDRLAVSIDLGSAIQVSLESYFAITSNTLQTGARLWAVAEAGKFSVEGGASFNALIYFSPFHFLADLGCSVEVRYGDTTLMGVHLALDFSGPSPWHAVGTATFTILFIDVDFRVEGTIGGGSDPATVEAVDLGAALGSALALDEAWAATPPDSTEVTLRDAAVEGELWAHPDGAIEVRQHLAPLKQTIDCYGNAPISGDDWIEITAPKIGMTEATDATDLFDWFAPSMFLRLSTAEKLSRPSFEQMTCGIGFGAATVTTGAPAGCALDYECFFVDPEADGQARPRIMQLDVDRLTATLPTSLSARAAARRPTARTRTVSNVTVAPTRWIVARTDTLARVSSIQSAATTFTEAQAVLDAWLLSRPQDAANYQIVPEAEVS